MVKTSESPLDSKEIKPVNLKGNLPWILVRRTDAEAEGLLYWSSDVNRWLAGKVSDAAHDWGKKKVTENEMAGWASPMQWTWTWANFRRWWGTARYGVLQSMGLQIQLGKWKTTISGDKAVPGRVEEEKGCEDNGNTKLSPTDGRSG